MWSTKKDIILLNDYYSYIYTADNTASISHKFTKNQLDELIKAYTYIIDSYQEHDLNKTFIQSQFKLYIQIIMSFIIRSDEDYNTKKIMIDKTSHIISKYNYDYSLTFYWQIIHNLILKKQYRLIRVLSALINSVFENKLFIKFFRNKS
ncbi:hypothetical protein [Methanosphaera sp.]